MPIYRSECFTYVVLQKKKKKKEKKVKKRKRKRDLRIVNVMQELFLVFLNCEVINFSGSIVPASSLVFLPFSKGRKMIKISVKCSCSFVIRYRN